MNINTLPPHKKNDHPANNKNISVVKCENHNISNLNTLNSKKRDAGLDMAKGFTMICIIAGHLSIDIVSRFVFTFHVPLFFLLSGYFYTYKAGTLKSRLTRYSKPYIFTATILLLLGELKVIAKIIFGKTDVQEIFTTAFHWITAALYGSGSKTQFFEWYIPAIGAIWFLLALMWSIAIMQILNRMKLSPWKQDAIVITLFAIGYFSAFQTWFPFSVQAGFSALLFVFVGHAIKQRHIKVYDTKEAILITIVLWIWSLYFSYTNDFMSLVRSYFPNMLHNILGALAASYLIIYLCKKMEHCQYIAPFLSVFGRYSAVVLCFHLIELSFVPWGYIHAVIPHAATAMLIIFSGKVLFCYAAILLVRRSSTLKYIFNINE